MMVTTGAVVGTAAFGAGTVAAETAFNWDSDYAHESVLRNSVTISEVSSLADLQYVDEDGNDATLGDAGYRVDDPDGEQANPISFGLGDVDAPSVLESFESVLTASEWTTSGTTVSETDGDLVISGEGTATYTLDSSESSDLIAMLVASVTGATDVTLRFLADTNVSESIATSDVSGLLWQEDLEDLESAVGTVTDIEIETTGADSEVSIHGFDLRGDLLSIGSREANSDGDLESIETHSGGPVEIASADALSDELANAADALRDVTIAVEQRARDLEDSRLVTALPTLDESEVEDTQVTLEHRARMVANHRAPQDGALSWTFNTLEISGILDATPADRYATIGYDAGRDSAITLIEDGLALSGLTDVSGDVTQDTDLSIDLSGASVSAGQYITAVLDVGLESDEQSDLDGSGFFGIGGGSGGGDGFLSPIRAAILALAGLAGTILAFARSRAADAADVVN